jgi:hypothetical protein
MWMAASSFARYIPAMIEKLRELVRRAEHWPEQAQEELAELGAEIEKDLRGEAYEATREELRAIDEAISEIERGELATDAEVRAAFAKFRSA